MRLIKLNNSEVKYIKTAKFLSEAQKKMFQNSSETLKNFLMVKISEAEADNMRDLFEEQLQIVGFDKNYNLTPEGIILQSLSDKFF